MLTQLLGHGDGVPLFWSIQDELYVLVEYEKRLNSLKNLTFDAFNLISYQ